MTSFNITTPTALLRKLLQEQDDFTKENCLNERHALNAVMTAYHLHEWVWWAFLKEGPDVRSALQLPPDKNGRISIRSFRDWLGMEKQCPAFADARHITNGTKHYQRKSIQMGKHEGPFDRSVFQANVFDVPYLWVERNGREQRAEEFIAELTEFWTTFFKTHDIP